MADLVLEIVQADIEQALYKHLTSMHEVRALVGDAISPVNAAQGEILPRITYQLIGDEPVLHLKGETGQKVATFHVKCWAGDPGLANGIAKAVAGRRANPRLAGYQGFMGELIRVAFVKVNDRASEVELPMDGGEPGEYWRLLVVVVQYSDPV